MVTSLKSRFWRAVFLPGSFREESVFLPFLTSFRGKLHSLACAPSSVFRTHHFNISFCSHISFSLGILPPTYKDLCDYPGPTQITWDNCHLNILNLIPSVKSLPCKVAYSQILGTFLRDYYSVNHNMWAPALFLTLPLGSGSQSWMNTAPPLEKLDFQAQRKNLGKDIEEWSEWCSLEMVINSTFGKSLVLVSAFWLKH